MPSQSPVNWLLLHAANLALHALHLGVIVFFLGGWLYGPTHPYQLALGGLILLSWFGLGVWKGFGYCLITDLQWKVRRLLGSEPPTEYYVKYIIDTVTGGDAKPSMVNAMTTYVFFGVLAVSALWYTAKVWGG